MLTSGTIGIVGLSTRYRFRCCLVAIMLQHAAEHTGLLLDESGYSRALVNVTIQLVGTYIPHAFDRTLGLAIASSTARFIFA